MALVIRGVDVDGDALSAGSVPRYFGLVYAPETLSSFWSSHGSNYGAAKGSFTYTTSISKEYVYNDNGDAIDEYWHYSQSWTFSASRFYFTPETYVELPPLTYSGSKNFDLDYYEPDPGAPAPDGDVLGDVLAQKFDYRGHSGRDTFFFEGFNNGGVAYGGSGDDNFYGSSGADTLKGESGNDNIRGGEGDVLDGGTGDDYVAGVFGSTMVGGGGVDHLTLDLGSMTEAATLRPTLQATRPVLVAPGTSISGFEQFNVTFGSAGDALDLRGASLRTDATSYFYGRDGSDTLYIDSASRGSIVLESFETLNANLTNLTTGATISDASVNAGELNIASWQRSYFSKMIVTGGSGDDNFYGSSGADTLKGESGNDTLTGAAGRDIIDGGNDDDRLSGGSGGDMFAFRSQFGVDTITDFSTQSDKIKFVIHGVGDFQAVMAHASMSGTDTIIDFGDGQKLVIEDVAMTHLSEDSFLFG